MFAIIVVVCCVPTALPVRTQEKLRLSQMSKQATPISVLLVEEHRLFREGLRAVIETSEDCRIAGEAATLDDALRIMRRTPVDVVLVDIRLFTLTGPDGIRLLTRENGRLRVLVLSLDNDSGSVLSALRTGVHGMLPKNTTAAALMDAIRSVARGGVYLGPHVAEKLFSSIRQGQFDRPAQSDPELGLAPREVQLLRLIASGKSSKEIAVLLDLSVQTVRTYRKNLMKKVGVGNAAGLTRFAMFHGLIGPKSQSPD
ncbi:MAG: response regulator transcription factor [Bryobacteraceae bacterium]|nr:response regulator transcription factor [Bryobacteraceae bacterium]